MLVQQISNNPRTMIFQKIHWVSKFSKLFSFWLCYKPVVLECWECLLMVGHASGCKSAVNDSLFKPDISNILDKPILCFMTFFTNPIWYGGHSYKTLFFLNKNLFNLFFTSLCYIFILSCFIGKLHVGSKAGKKYKTSKILRAKHDFSCKLTTNWLPLQINLSQGI